jgi:MFS family permease
MSGIARIFTALVILLAPWMATRIGRLKTIVYTSLLSIPILLFVGLSPFLMVSVILYPLFQGFWNMSNGIWLVFGMEIVQPEHRGLANSSYQISGQIAGAVAVPIGGLLISRLGYIPVFWIAAVLYFLSQTLLWFPFGGKDFVAPDTSVGTTGEQDGKVMTSLENTEQEQDSAETRISPESPSDEAERV